MSPDWQIDDDTAEAIVRGDLAGDQWTHLVTFARQVQELEDAPAPAPSTELALLLDGTELPQLGASTGHDQPAESVPVAASEDGSLTATGRLRHSSRRRRMPLVEALAAKAAGLGMVAKVGVCASAVAATGATAAGVHTVTSSSGDGTEVATEAGADDVAAGANSDVNVDKGAKTKVDDVADTDAGLDGADISTGVAGVDVSDDGSVQIDLDVPVNQLLRQHTLDEVLAEVSLEELLQRYTAEDLLAEVTLEELLSVVSTDELLQVVSVEELLAAGVPLSEVQKHLPEAALPDTPAVPSTPDLPETPETAVPVPAPESGIDTGLGG